MTMNTHVKHPPITKPRLGKFHRVELGIVGAPCDMILSLAVELKESVSPQVQIAYIDASHAAAQPGEFSVSWVDHGTHFVQEDTVVRLSCDHYGDFRHVNGVIVNANHFEAAEQLVIIHPKKRDSLFKRLGQLSNIVAIVLAEGADEPFDFLIQANDLSHVPVFRISERERIGQWFVNWHHAHIPEVKGLILAGGQSLRMGTDKSKLNYHGVDQLRYLGSLFDKLGMEYFISRRDSSSLPNELDDRFIGLGPMGALLTAFQRAPDVCWLSVACDLPLVDITLLESLIARRNVYKAATCFYNRETSFPEPMIALWEPIMYHRLLYFMTLGYSCPRKVLINSNIEMIDDPLLDRKLMNVNTPEEKDRAIKIINPTVSQQL